MPAKPLSAKMRFATFEKKFVPQFNHLASGAPVSGFGYETFGAELAHVQSVVTTEPGRVWTVVEGGNGKWYVTNGYHRVNRVAYIITRVPCDRPQLEIFYV